MVPQRSYGVSALTGWGKSHLLIQCGHVNAVAGVPVLVFSAELDDRTVRTRWIAHATGRDSRKIVTPQTDLTRLRLQVEAIAELPIRIQTRGEPSIAYIEAHISDWKQRHREPGGLVLVDYAGLVSKDPGRQGDFADQDNTANALADLARRYDCAVLTAHQQNKRAYSTTEFGGGVSKGNVFGGGGQVHRLDGLVLIDRTGGGHNDTQVSVDLRVAKNRHGPERTVACTLDMTCGRFEEITGSRGASTFELGDFV
jgi:replicative DNA helicase